MWIMFIALFKEIFLSVLGKVAIKAVGERFITRVVLLGLNKLKNMSSNTLLEETCEDIILSLQGKGLKVIDSQILKNKNESVLKIKEKLNKVEFDEDTLKQINNLLDVSEKVG